MVQNRRDWFLNTWSGRSDWHVYAPAGWGAAETMLARRSRFDVLDRGSIFVCDTAGAGTPPPPRYLNWVTYKLKATGTVITHIHSHPNSHIDNAGHPYDLPRTVDAEKHFRMIRDLAVAKKADGQVVVTGDFNVDFVDDRRVQYEHFPYVVLDERDRAAALPGLRSCYAQFGVSATGTHGSRHIDYVYEWVKLPAYRRIWMTGYDVLAKQNSDHRPVVARFDVRR